MENKSGKQQCNLSDKMKNNEEEKKAAHDVCL